jgi:AraC-like DNA-binding protein
MLSRPSNWPIPIESIRAVLPRRMVAALQAHPLAKALYPLALGYYKHAFLHQMSRQRHDDCLLLYCVDGVGHLHIGPQSYTVRAGHLVVLPKEVIHHYRADEKNPWSIYWLHCDGEHIQAYLSLLSPEAPLNYVLDIGVHSRLIADFEAILDLRQYSQRFEAYLHSSQLLHPLFSHIALLKTQQQHAFQAGLDLDTIHALMQSHLHEQLDIDTLANAVNLSKFHFIKRYKARTGRTPIHDFIQMKIERACHLLDITDQSVNEIGWAIGYQDAYYFSRVFRKVMGISPSQYRRIRLGEATYKD